MILLDQAGAGAGRARIIAPTPAYEPFVEHFWTQHGESAPIGRTWRVIPELNPNLIFGVLRDGSPLNARCILVGPRSRFADVDCRLTGEIGLAPKRILRIQRLHRSLALSQQGACGWAQVASGSGFADQAHMVREFVDLLGESPTVWRQRGGEAYRARLAPLLSGRRDPRRPVPFE